METAGLARLFPSTADSAAADDAGPRVIGVDDAKADGLLSAMSSETARQVLAGLHESPATPSEVANRVNTTPQNAQYHLKKLEDADAIEVVDTVYSEKGREMDVYAPADKPLVVVAGGESETAGLRTALTSLFGGLGVLAVASVIVQRLVDGGTGSVRDAAVSPTTATEVSIMAAETPAPTPVAGGGSPLPVGVVAEPGVLFFAGGAIGLIVALLLGRAR